MKTSGEARARDATNLLLKSIITVGVSLLDESNGDLVKLVEVIRSVGDGVELDVQELEILLDRLLELGLEDRDEEGRSQRRREAGSEREGESRAHLLLEGVGIVESKQQLSVVLVGEVSVEESSLGVTDVEVT